MELTTTKLPTGTVNNEEASVSNVTKPDAITKLPPGINDYEEASTIANLTEVYSHLQKR